MTRPSRRPNGEVELLATINRVMFRNDENGWSALRCTLVDPETKETLFDNGSVVGTFAGVRLGGEYKLKGTWVEHPRFGMQFKAEEAEAIMPTTQRGMAMYLATLVYGIGMKRAEAIVRELGDECLQKIKEGPECMHGIPGVNNEQAQALHEAIAENESLAELSALICRHGITPRLAAKIHAVYKSDAVRTIKENPYLLISDLWGVGFATADRIASAVGIEGAHPARVEAAVLHILAEVANNDGHCYLTPKDLMRYIAKIVDRNDVSVQDVAEAVQRLQDASRIVRIDDRIYDLNLYRAEANVAYRIARVVQGMDRPPMGDELARDAVEKLAGQSALQYEEQQLEAVHMALTNWMSIITGGPGTGKTTVLRAVVDLWQAQHPYKYLYLASPTGRAAKRLRESTGMHATTIHRLLGYRPELGFTVNEDAPLEPGMLVIDEASMIDIELMSALMDAVPPGMQVLLVGDIDQLPSVGPGSVLRDCIDSGVIPTTRLRFNFRQAGGSKIAEQAHWIVNGHIPSLEPEGDWDVRIVQTPEEAADLVVKEIAIAHVTQGLSPLDVQVLAPQKRGTAGVNTLNERVREVINPIRDQEMGFFAVGDKVMVVRNDTGKDVYNGDIGIVTGMTHKGVDDEGDGVWVKFDDSHVVHFDVDEMAQLLTLAYASTVHKSQGSEFPLVIALCTRQSWIMLQRNLLYTAITRARDRLILIGQADAIKQAVANDRIRSRNSHLKELLQSHHNEMNEMSMV